MYTVQDPEAFEREYTTIISPDVPSATPGRRSNAVCSDNEAIDDFTTVGKGGKVMQFTSEGIFKNLQAVQEARGKKVRSKLPLLKSYLTSPLSTEHGSGRTNPYP